MHRPAGRRQGDSEFGGNRYAADSQLFYCPITQQTSGFNAFRLFSGMQEVDRDHRNEAGSRGFIPAMRCTTKIVYFEMEQKKRMIS